MFCFFFITEHTEATTHLSRERANQRRLSSIFLGYTSRAEGDTWAYLTATSTECLTTWKSVLALVRHMLVPLLK